MRTYWKQSVAPDAADKCRADLLEAIRLTRRILVRFEKHLDTAQRSDSRKHIKTRLVAHTSDLLRFESTMSLRISREITNQTTTIARVPYSGPPEYKVVIARQQPTAKSNNSLKPGSKVIKRSTNTIAPLSTIN